VPWIAIEIVRRIDALFEVERSINGKSAEERRTVRQERSRPLVEELQVYMREQRAKLSRGHDLAKAINYILKRWAAFISQDRKFPFIGMVEQS
jgi:transposase